MVENTPGFPRLSGVLTAAGAVACAATVLGFLGRFTWFLDLFSHFRVQYLAGLGVLGVLLLIGRRPKTAVVFFVFAGINLAVVLPLYFGGQAAAPDSSGMLRAMLLNVNTRLGDPARVRDAIRDADADILVLEEISSRWVRDLAWLANSHPHSVVEPREDNFGIGLFSKFPLADEEVVGIGDAGVPSILATVDTGSAMLRVIATHPLPPIGAVYWRWRNDQLEELPRFIDSSQPTILIGDLNVTPWNDHFRRLLKRSGLIDSSRGRGIQPTWPSGMPWLYVPIDHVLHSRHISVARRTIGEDVGSDHYPLIVDFVIHAVGTGGAARD